MQPDLVLLPRVAYRGDEITARRVRDLLAPLADDLSTGTSSQRLVQGPWPQEHPEHPAS